MCTTNRGNDELFVKVTDDGEFISKDGKYTTTELSKAALFGKVNADTNKGNLMPLRIVRNIVKSSKTWADIY